MQVRDVMTKRPNYLNADATIREAANAMREHGTGFEPLGDGSFVTGVVTDRDIAVRAVAEGENLDDKASSIATEKALYTFEDNSVDDVIENMAKQEVQRLLVLDNAEDKNLVGIITIGDIADKCEDDALAKKIVSAARHYH